MKNDEYSPRIIDKTVDSYLSSFGAVCIEGPKWCGKTWTSAFHSESAVYIEDPSGNFQNRSLAEIDPSLILDGAKPRLIDEWQDVPAIWDAVRFCVDKNPEKGQFILTGSSTPQHKGILHSGAGRIAKLRMRTMSLYESGISSGMISLRRLCQDVSLDPVMTGPVKLDMLADCIIRGGWPANQGIPIEHAAYLPKQYINAIIDDDVFRLDGIKRDKHKMELLLRSLARNESTTATNRRLTDDIREMDYEDTSVETTAEYLDVFSRLYITDNQRPFGSRLRPSVRVKQAEKRHLADPSIASAVLGATPKSLIGDLSTFGFLFEALCERDMRIYAESFGAELYHYQDYSDNEIDAVISLPDGSWCGFEIKLGANQIDAAADNLLRIQRAIMKDGGVQAKAMCVISGLSNAAYRRPDGIFVIPITALAP